MGDDSFPEFFVDSEFDDLFSILKTLESSPIETIIPPLTVVPSDDQAVPSLKERLVSQKSASSSFQRQVSDEIEFEASPRTSRKRKVTAKPASSTEEEVVLQDGQQKIPHITVERNRRKQMNEHLLVLRSLMPCFYVKRRDQASIIGGVVDYIKEMQQVLQLLEAKKQRKVYSEVLSPRLVSSPKPLPLSPRKPPLSPRLILPISPRTPKQTSPYKPRMQPQQQGYLSPTISSTTTIHDQPCSPSSSSYLDNINVNELVTNSKSSVAEVEVKFLGPNLLLKTISAPIPGQATKIISALEGLSLEILHVSMNTVDATTMLNSFTIKIGIECELSVEELAHEIQQTFCYQG